MKRVPFKFNRRYTKGVIFSWIMVYKRVRGWTSGRSLAEKKICWVLPPPPPFPRCHAFYVWGLPLERLHMLLARPPINTYLCPEQHKIVLHVLLLKIFSSNGTFLLNSSIFCMWDLQKKGIRCEITDNAAHMHEIFMNSNINPWLAPYQ